MADAVAIRRLLAAFLGDERYREFVRQLRSAGRLRYWQQREWEQFVAAHPGMVAGPEELAAALRVCELHGSELVAATVPVVGGCRDYTKSFIEARTRLFPNAASGPVSTEGLPCQDDRAGVWYCPMCRQAEAEWLGSKA